MKIYKNHNPLFLHTFDKEGNKMSLTDSHFWINSKSFVVVSIELNGSVKGKSNLLNHLFNTNF